MADFFSQFQVHPPTPPAGFDPNTGIAPRQDFNLGGFQPAPYVPGGNKPTGGAPVYGPDTGGVIGQPNDPRLSPLPQPWQQGPVMVGPGMPGDQSNFLGGERIPQPYQPWQQLPTGPAPPYATAPPGSTMPSPDPNDPVWGGKQTGPEWGGWGNDFPNLGGVSPQMPLLGPAAQMGPNGPTYTNGQGQATDQFGNPMGTSNQTGQVNLSPLANGIGQPMNPSQQSGMVLMRSPDGLHVQLVPQAHVDHYTGLGATQVTGPQLTGSSYGGSI